ncbi:hypothetical protein Dfri01_25060 [Dyadobacter frigoris]|uniref:AAA family ATPase n=1 Tax=Dyadobacter frigoris TaxID=2576211 RepID=UPI0024A595C4|nr:AAA family ATPase [Dyadobacter frigoris]GLU53045.1 hypothetical protein Dfri01_25060 [Dyadobacter frigoris]
MIENKSYHDKVKIKKLHIKNFKSLVDLEIVEPNPFTVFVGANGVGKSNIFEALEFVNISSTTFFDSVVRVFGGEKTIANNLDEIFEFECEFDNAIDKFTSSFISDFIGGKALNMYFTKKGHNFENSLPNPSNNFYPGGIAYRIPQDSITGERVWLNPSYKQFFGSFCHIFIRAYHKEVTKYIDYKSLSLSASNLEKVLKRILLNEDDRIEIIEWLQLFIPGLEKVEIHSDNIGGTDTLLVYEKGASKPFDKNLISDGTYNILCLLTAVYQSDEPQFLCIEEPENGLNPFVIKELVTLFRNACKEKGHYIWLNTHSQSLVEALTPDEIILVDKVNGETKIKQTKGMNLYGLPTDEAWLSGALGGGTPW